MTARIHLTARRGRAMLHVKSGRFAKDCHIFGIAIIAPFMCHI